MANFYGVGFMKDAKLFMDGLDEKSRNKVYNIRKAQHIKDEDVFKKIDPEIWEFRTLYNKRTIRLQAFWDKSDNKETIVIATHGFFKKTSKTPKSEIERAKEMRNKYFKLKNDQL